MNKFKHNIVSIYKEQGQKWLENLPNIINQLSQQWELTSLTPVANLSFNFVLKGLRGKQHIILKIGLDHEYIEREAMALKTWDGIGAAKIYEFDQTLGAILLEQACPGDSLLPYASSKNNDAIRIACSLIAKMHSVDNRLDYNFPHISEWLNKLEYSWDLPEAYLSTARNFRDKLLATTEKEVLLHGDLHHENIINNNNEWLVIDPKGVIGDPAGEYWSMVKYPQHDLPLIAEITGYKIERITKWCFVRGVLSACWCLEDNIDPSIFMKFISSLSGMTD